MIPIPTATDAQILALLAGCPVDLSETDHDANLAKGDQDGDELTDAEWESREEQRDWDRYMDRED
jgi:hypothetical protein